ncbi:MAG: YgjP-like metallopeptidase domain-containing protein [Chitinophagales bacterium]|nr:YgjP-like metallopeptidase domain-containing protein [Chitinophagales bacterium]
MATKPKQYRVNVDGHPVNLFIHQEARRNSRVSVSRKGIIIRLPRMMDASQKSQQVNAFLDWAKIQLRKKPELYLQHTQREYVDGYCFQLRGKTYSLLFMDSTGIAASKAKQSNGTIYLWLAEGLDEEQRRQVVPTLISRCIAREYYNFMHNQLLYLNELYFNKQVLNFRLKYTHSVWGSCSRRGNINISTRLLFAPDDVIDYVLIHELAHLVHHDHSANFWAEVARAMPDYKEKMKWLKANGGKCDF